MTDECVTPSKNVPGNSSTATWAAAHQLSEEPPEPPLERPPLEPPPLDSPPLEPPLLEPPPDPLEAPVLDLSELEPPSPEPSLEVEDSPEPPSFDDCFDFRP
jgi:hypothetical protein